ncbi:putative l-asparaginase protein [Lasiodiplodia theobromae]|nr:putative l-asparaginase protein [Lasiodiplodia theobromae]
MLSSTFSVAAAAAAALLPSTISATPLGLPILPRAELEQPSINASLPNITIFATGGTIASQGSSSAQTVGYQVGLGVQQLVDAVPEVLNISNIYGQQIANVGSQNINATVLLQLARNITAELEKDDVQGVVVTHGTDTMEETAFFLDLVVNSTKPVVVVGAMRPATALSADGPLNLYQAVSLAASEKAQGRGVMIALNDRIGSAFYTQKNNANSLDTFYATEQGQLGFFINQEAASAAFNASGVAMVASRRTPDGFVPKEDVEDWMVAAGFLNPQKSRILLQLALDAGYSVDEIRETFDGLHP